MRKKISHFPLRGKAALTASTAATQQLPPCPCPCPCPTPLPASCCACCRNSSIEYNTNMSTSRLRCRRRRRRRWEKSQRESFQLPRQTARGEEGEETPAHFNVPHRECSKWQQDRKQGGAGSGAGQSWVETNQSAEWLSLRVLNYAYFV